MTPRIGLYYPYLRFRSDTWLKGAALYRPRLARVVPARYPVVDSATVLALVDGLDFVVDVDPAPAVAATSALLTEAVETHRDALRGRYGAAGSGRSRWAQPAWRENPERVLAEVAWPHADRNAGRLRQALWQAGLCAESRGPHPEVVWVYLCALAERLAAANDLEPTTDQAAAQVATHGWTVERMAAVLLDRPEPLPPERQGRLGVLAVQAVVPRDLAGVPVEKIMRVRRKYGAEFEAFHATVAALATDVATEVSAGAGPTALDGYLRRAVVDRLRGPLADLTAALRGAGLDTVLSAQAVQFEVPPAEVPAAAQPTVVGTATAALGLRAVARPRPARRPAVVPTAVSHLWNVDRGTARGLLRRMLS